MNDDFPIRNLPTGLCDRNTDCITRFEVKTESLFVWINFCFPSLITLQLAESCLMSRMYLLQVQCHPKNHNFGIPTDNHSVGQMTSLKGTLKLLLQLICIGWGLYFCHGSRMLNGLTFSGYFLTTGLNSRISHTSSITDSLLCRVRWQYAWINLSLGKNYRQFYSRTSVMFWSLDFQVFLLA